MVSGLWGHAVRFGVLWRFRRFLSIPVRSGGLEAGSWVRSKLERKRRWAKVLLGSGQIGASAAAEKTSL